MRHACNLWKDWYNVFHVLVLLVGTSWHRTLFDVMHVISVCIPPAPMMVFVRDVPRGHMSQIALLRKSKFLRISHVLFSKSPARAFAFRNHCCRNAEDKFCPKQKLLGFICSPLGVLPRDVGLRGLPKQVAAHEGRIGIQGAIGTKFVRIFFLPPPLQG